MFWTLWIGFLVALLRNVAPAAAVVYRDPDTGLTFSQAFQLYKSDGRGITFRIAIPEGVDQYSPYDAVVQVVVPNDVGWAGLAWGGGMSRNPLLTVWRNSANNGVVVGSRWANGHVTPQPYNNAQYTIFKTGTKTNNTHFQMTAMCRGCTSWMTPEGGSRFLSPRGGNRLAFAYSPSRPSNPNSNTSTFPVHDVHGYWSHDFLQGANRDFSVVVEKLQVS